MVFYSVLRILDKSYSTTDIVGLADFDVFNNDTLVIRVCHKIKNELGKWPYDTMLYYCIHLQDQK